MSSLFRAHSRCFLLPFASDLPPILPIALLFLPKKANNLPVSQHLSLIAAFQHHGPSTRILPTGSTCPSRLRNCLHSLSSPFLCQRNPNLQLSPTTLSLTLSTDRPPIALCYACASAQPTSKLNTLPRGLPRSHLPQNPPLQSDSPALPQRSLASSLCSHNARTEHSSRCCITW